MGVGGSHDGVGGGQRSGKPAENHRENKQSSERAAFPSSILLKTLHFIVNSHLEKGT